MRRLAVFLLAAAGLLRLQARNLGFGVDAFNRVVTVSETGPRSFSPLSFEIDCVVFAEAVDPIRRAIFSSALHVMDEFEVEYRPLARLPFEAPGTNGVDLAWAHALVVDEPRRIDPSFRLGVQDLYGVEVCRAKAAKGVEAWVRARFAGELGWKLPALPAKDRYALHDLVSVSVKAAPAEGWKRLCATHTVCRQPLVGGADFYAIVPKSGRAISSVRTRLTSATLDEILAASAAVVDKPVPTRFALPPVDCISTNELMGAFSYFKFPMTALKPFPPGLRPETLRQVVRFRLTPAPEATGAESIRGPFVFFIHDPVANTIPAMGVIP